MEVVEIGSRANGCCEKIMKLATKCKRERKYWNVPTSSSNECLKSYEYEQVVPKRPESSCLP